MKRNGFSNREAKAKSALNRNEPGRFPVRAAAVAASLLMLIFGTTYRVVDARLETPVKTPPISQAALDRFPSQIGEWEGQDVAMDEATIRQTDTDARINRQYSRRSGLGAISFYVASGVKARDLMPHHPEVCYIGAGWTLVSRRATELPLTDGTALPCNILQFSRGALGAQRIIVLDYYIVDGQRCPDVSRLRSKAWHGSGAVRYVAQVQITTGVAETQPANVAEMLICGFAADSASSVAGLFQDIGEILDQDESREPLKEK